MEDRNYKGWILNPYPYGNLIKATKGGESFLAESEETLRTYIDRKEKTCAWLKDEVCTNADCDCCADYPAKHFCCLCEYWQ